MASESKKRRSATSPEMKEFLSAVESMRNDVKDLRSIREDESELRESRDRLNEIIDSIGDAFYAVDANDRFIFVNRITEEWTGRPQGSLIGKNVWEEFPETIDSQFYRMHQLARKKNHPVHFESETPINGRWLDVSIYPDKRGGLSCYFRDITARRKSDEDSRSQSEQLQLVLESVTDYAIFTIDDKGIVTSWNRGAENNFGYKEKEMVGESAEILFTPEDRRKGVPRREMTTALETGKAQDERWHMRKDGSVFFVSGIMQPLTPVGTSGFVKICRDQTDKLEAQTAIRERAILERLVRTQEDERRRIARDLHDTLGQKITALRLKLEGLKATYRAEPAFIKAFDEAQVQAKSIDEEISFMTWELRPTVLDNLGLRRALAAFVREWSKNYEIEAEFHSARQRKFRLEQELEINLYRIAQEALNNVMKHAKADKVDVMLEYGKETVVLVVEDNGVGFDVKAAQRRVKRGERLGLVGMHERAALLGGTLEIESARLKGTTVIARMPMRFEENQSRAQREKRRA